MLRPARSSPRKAVEEELRKRAQRRNRTGPSALDEAGALGAGRAGCAAAGGSGDCADEGAAAAASAMSGEGEGDGEATDASSDISIAVIDGVEDEDGAPYQFAEPQRSALLQSAGQEESFHVGTGAAPLGGGVSYGYPLDDGPSPARTFGSALLSAQQSAEQSRVMSVLSDDDEEDALPSHGTIFYLDSFGGRKVRARGTPRPRPSPQPCCHPSPLLLQLCCGGCPWVLCARGAAHAFIAPNLRRGRRTTLSS